LTLGLKLFDVGTSVKLVLRLQKCLVARTQSTEEGDISPFNRYPIHDVPVFLVQRASGLTYCQVSLPNHLKSSHCAWIIAREQYYLEWTVRLLFTWNVVEELIR